MLVKHCKSVFMVFVIIVFSAFLSFNAHASTSLVGMQQFNQLEGGVIYVNKPSRQIVVYDKRKEIKKRFIIDINLIAKIKLDDKVRVFYSNSMIPISINIIDQNLELSEGNKGYLFISK